MITILIKENEFVLKMREFFLSNLFLIICFFIAAIVNVCGEYVANYGAQLVGFLIFGIITSVVLVISDELICSLYPVLLVSMFALKCYDSFSIFVKYWPFIFIFVAAVLFHLIHYRKKPQIGTTFWGVVAVAVSVTLGGVGKITKEEYFSLTALYYTIMLGIGMVAAYLIISAYYNKSDKYKLNQKFVNIMVMVGAFACFMVIHHYIVNIDEVLEGNGVLAFQWRNNIATFLMIALPFPFYKSSKNRHIYLYMGVFMFLCLLLTGSRGAVTFGSVEFAMCVISVIVYDKEHRKSNILIFAVLIGICTLFLGKIFHFFSDVTNRLTFESGEFDVRLGLYRRAVEDFLSNPLFGRGIGYMGNRDIHPSKDFALCWYHSLPFQIIGSFGICGIIGYGIQYFVRFKALFRDFKSRFNITIFLSFAGLEMMSIVNPGQFCPLPYALLCVMMFVLVEKCNDIRENKK